LKRNERASRKRQSVTDGVPKHLPALMKAEKVQKKVARVGFGWPNQRGVLAKVEEEVAELKQALRRGEKPAIDEELGDLLFALVNLARWQKRSPEDLMNRAVQKFIGRFRQVETEVARRGRRLGDCSLPELDEIWNTVKLRK
jgi:tetrapyrrole methylase family protein/MazG family protein